MNRPTRITPAKVRTFALTLLGIAASVGLGSLIASPTAVHETRVRASCARNGPARYSLVSDNTSSVTVCPTPEPKKPLQEGYERIKCDKCGQEYDAPNVGCWRLLELEEIKHLHLSPQAEARMIKSFNARQEVVKYPRDLGNGVVQISKNVTMTKEGGEVFYHLWRE